MLLWFSEQLTPHFLSIKYAWTAETGGGTRERRPIENADKTSSTNQPMENNNKLLFQRLVCVTQDLKAAFGRK